jgi:hypothetical protein
MEFVSISACVGLGYKTAGRNVSRVHVGIVDRVELRPQDLALAFQGADDLFLLAADRGACRSEIEGERGVFGVPG